MKKKVVSKYSWIYKGVSLDHISVAVPDQSLSVEEILRRFTSGTLVESEIERGHSYGSDICPDEDFDNLRPEYDSNYDLVDAYAAAQQAEPLRSKAAAEAAAANSKKSKKKMSEPQSTLFSDKESEESTSNDDNSQESEAFP